MAELGDILGETLKKDDVHNVLAASEQPGITLLADPQKVIMVFLNDQGAKINAIKALRVATGLGLKDAKTAVEHPSGFRVSRRTAEIILKEYTRNGWGDIEDWVVVGEPHEIVI